MCDVISREHAFNYYCIGTITHLHNMVFMHNLISNTYSYSYPIRMDAYFVCVLSILLWGKNPQKGAYPLHIPNSMIVYIIVWSMEINYYEMQS